MVFKKIVDKFKVFENAQFAGKPRISRKQCMIFLDAKFVIYAQKSFRISCQTYLEIHIDLALLPSVISLYQ